MTADLYPLQVLLVTLAGWVNRHQQHVIEYLVEENRVLKGQLEGRRLRLTDDQRRRLAAKGRRLGRRVSVSSASLRRWRPCTIPRPGPRIWRRRGPPRGGLRQAPLRRVSPIQSPSPHLGAPGALRTAFS
jgi:hypothetical protein